MSFVHQREVFFFFNVSEVLSCNFLNIIPSYHNSIIFSHSSGDFVLLSLILNDWLLHIILVFELFSPTWVSRGRNYSQSIDFWRSTANVLTNLHHCGIAHFWISFFLYLPFWAHWNILSEHVSLWNHNIIKQ
jgi:hypothetical protein